MIVITLWNIFSWTLSLSQTAGVVARHSGGCGLDEGADSEAAAECFVTRGEECVTAGVCTVRDDTHPNTHTHTHTLAPFTLHVGPGKLPENCRSAFCVNANTSRDWSRVKDLVTLPGSVPERALCEQKPDQCRKGCVVVMTHFIVRLFYRLFWRQINVHTMKNV